MNTKRIAALILTCIIAVGVTACNSNNNQSDPSLAEGNPNTAGAGTELSSPSEPGITEPESSAEGSLPADETRYGESEISDENVSIVINFDREEYTINDVVGVKATVTNKGDKTIVFVKGSGSNSVPDAFESALGGFSTLFRPFAMTLDYQMEHLKPGESVTYDLPYAPYVALTQDGIPSTDQNLDRFREDTENYKAAEAGPVDGTIKFTYYIQENDDENTLYAVDNLEPIVLEGTINATIVA